MVAVANFTSADFERISNNADADCGSARGHSDLNGHLAVVPVQSESRCDPQQMFGTIRRPAAIHRGHRYNMGRRAGLSRRPSVLARNQSVNDGCEDHRFVTKKLVLR